MEYLGVKINKYEMIYELKLHNIDNAESLFLNFILE